MKTNHLVYWQQSFEAKLWNWHSTNYNNHTSLITACYARWHEGQQRRSFPPSSGPASGLSTPYDNSESPLHLVVLD